MALGREGALQMVSDTVKCYFSCTDQKHCRITDVHMVSTARLAVTFSLSLSRARALSLSLCVCVDKHSTCSGMNLQPCGWWKHVI